MSWLCINVNASSIHVLVTQYVNLILLASFLHNTRASYYKFISYDMKFSSQSLKLVKIVHFYGYLTTFSSFAVYLHCLPLKFVFFIVVSLPCLRFLCDPVLFDDLIWISNTAPTVLGNFLQDMLPSPSGLVKPVQ